MAITATKTVVDGVVTGYTVSITGDSATNTYYVTVEIQKQINENRTVPITIDEAYYGNLMLANQEMLTALNEAVEVPAE